MIKKLFLMFVLMCANCAFAVPLKPYVFNNDYNHLSQYYQYIEDCNSWSTTDVLQQFNAGNFKTRQPNTAFSSGISTCNYWLAVSVLNRSDQYQKFLWSFYNNGLSFELYELRDGKLVFKNKSSMHFPIHNRPFPVRTVSFPFYLDKNQSIILFVKVSSTVSKNVYFPTDITTPEDFLLYEVDFSYLLGKYFGALIFALFVNLCLFFIIKERLYLYTIFYVMCIILFQLSDFHFDTFEIPEILYKHWSYVNKDFFIGLSIFFYAKIFTIFVDLKKHFPKLNSYFNVLKYILLSFTVLALVPRFVPYKNVYLTHAIDLLLNFWIYTVIGSISLIVVYGIWHRKKYFLLSGASFVFLFYGFISYLLNVLNSYHLPILKPGNIINGSVIEVSLLTIFFVYKFKIEKEATARKIIAETQKNYLLTKKMLTIESDEQERLSRNIHDEIGSDITGIRLQLENYLIEIKTTDNEQQSILQNVKHLYDKVRDISHFLNATDINASFLSTIENQIAFYQKNVRNVDFDLYTNIDANYSLDAEKQTQLTRVVKEIYTNALKHSMATKISMQIISENNQLQFFIEDNGIGFDVKTNFKSMGITNIKSRVLFLNGTILLESTNKGTMITIMIPEQNGNPL